MSPTLQAELAALRQAARIAPIGGAGDEDVHVPISANAAGDVVIIAPANQTMLIMEIFIWNGVGTQTLALKDGTQLLTQLTAFPAPSGILLGYTGNGKPHFKVTSGNALVLNLGVGTQVDGYVKYRTQQ